MFTKSVCSRISSVSEAGYFFGSLAYLLKPMNRFFWNAVIALLLLALIVPLPPSQAQVIEEWAKRFNNTTAVGFDNARAITTDVNGNVYVTGTSSTNTAADYNYVTIKYNPQGNQQWIKNYNGPANQADQATAVITDSFGNVYVSGYSFDPSTKNDFVTIKYDSQGNELWIKRYNRETYGSDEPNGDDKANAIGIDSQGNIHVSGTINGNFYVKVKYDPQGNQLQVTDYNITGSGLAIVNDAVIDIQGNLYLTGTIGDLTENDYTTVKYDPAGVRLWVKDYSYAEDSNDEPNSIAVDGQGNVYVTGISSSVPFPDYYYQYATIKYDRQGNEVWVRRYSQGEQTYNYAQSIDVDKSGNVYVSGYSNLPENGGQVNPFIKYDSQGTQLWVKLLENAGGIHVDAAYNIYSIQGGFVSLKYNASGTLLWKNDYNSAGNGEDYAVALALDGQGNVYVTGRISLLVGSSNSYFDYATVKYDAQGNQKWVKRYNGPDNGNDQPVAIAVDSQGNIIVTGFSFGGSSKPFPSPSNSDYNYDVLTIKYSPEGAELWVKRYASPNEGVDKATDMELDGQGNIYIAARERILTYDSQGNQLWVKTLTNGAIASFLTLDAQNNVYTTGINVLDSDVEALYSDKITTVKLNSQGNELWSKTFSKNQFTSASDMTVDHLGNVYIAGSSTLSNQYYDFETSQFTLKYNTNGNLSWTRYEYSEYSVDPEKAAYALVLDQQGNVYVLGKKRIFGQHYFTYTTYKYDPNGNQLWSKVYATDNTPGQATDITTDLLGDVYVTGNLGTIKYSSQGSQLWTQSYNGTPVAIILDALKNVYVTGTTIDGDFFADYSTAKYRQESETISCSATGSILQEVWRNVPGSLVSDIPLNTPPTASYQLTSFETTTNAGNNYGQRIRGYLCVPQNGSYTFYIAGDDRCELWLSSDDDPARKVKIASVPYFTGVREWNKYPSQKSVAIPLAAGKKYYIEALHKEGPYADNLAVGWQTSPTSPVTIIPGSALSPYLPQGKGSISREYWANVTGSLVGDIPLTTVPTMVDELNVFETATNAGNNYGQRIRGYVHPQVSGTYRFFIAGDDRCELWLSTDEDPARKTKVASVPYFTWSREWNKYASQQSALIYLVAGRKYYIEALHKEGLYSDNLAVGWTLPGQSTVSVITGTYLSPFLPASTTMARVGIEETSTNKVNVHPNPFENKLTLSSSQQGKLYITLTDNLGRIVYQSTQQAGEKELHLAHLKAGVYVVKISAEDGSTQVSRVVKK